MVIRNDLELGAPSQKVFPRKVREVLNLRVVWARCPLERPVGTLPACFVQGEIFDALPILERGELRPHGGFPSLYRQEFRPDGLDPVGESPDPSG